MSPVSEAKKRANKKWNSENYKRINMALPISEYEKISEYCQKHKISKNGFLRNAALEKMEREK